MISPKPHGNPVFTTRKPGFTGVSNLPKSQPGGGRAGAHGSDSKPHALNPWKHKPRHNQSILKEISPGISLGGMMLKLKLQYFGHLMQRVDLS